MKFENAIELPTLSLKKDGDFEEYSTVQTYGNMYFCPGDADGFYLHFYTEEAGVLTLHAGDSVFAGSDKKTDILSQRDYCLYFDVAPYVVNEGGQKRIYISAEFAGNGYVVLK